MQKRRVRLKTTRNSPHLLVAPHLLLDAPPCQQPGERFYRDITYPRLFGASRRGPKHESQGQSLRQRRHGELLGHTQDRMREKPLASTTSATVSRPRVRMRVRASFITSNSSTIPNACTLLWATAHLLSSRQITSTTAGTPFAFSVHIIRERSVVSALWAPSHLRRQRHCGRVGQDRAAQWPPFFGEVGIDSLTNPAFFVLPAQAFVLEDLTEPTALDADVFLLIQVSHQTI